MSTPSQAPEPGTGLQDTHIQLCTKREAADILRISERSIERMMSLGKILPVRVGSRSIRVNMADLREFVNSGGSHRTSRHEAPHE
jgi:excisionase family DNA binding protein